MQSIPDSEYFLTKLFIRNKAMDDKVTSKYTDI